MAAYGSPGQPPGPPAYCGRLCKALTGAFNGEGTSARSFACCGHLQRGEAAPHIKVHDVGTFGGTPLTREQATALQRVCEQAPFGRGEETVVDTHVRDTLQLDPAKFSVVNEAEWDARVSHILTDVCERLKVPRPAADVTAELHKLLLYKPGSFFKRHTDSEKVPGMFGTLVICLPAAYSGGQLLVHHRGDSQRFGSGELPPDVVSYVAFYADCEHEVKRVTSGYRLCLTYNLCHKHPGGPSTHSVRAGDSTAVAGAATAMKDWQADDSGPTMLCYVLDHMYTSRSRAALSVDALKGADASRAHAAMAAAAQAGVEVALVRIRRREDGEAADSENEYGHDPYDEDEDEDEDGSSEGGDKYQQRDQPESSGSDHGMMDVDQIDHVASEWVTVAGGQLGFRDIAISDEGMLQDWHFWRHVQPSSRVGGGYTGNEGAPMSLWYSQTALVMWRKRDNIAVQLQGTGFMPLLNYLIRLVERMQQLQQQQQQATVGQTAATAAAGIGVSTVAESSQAAAAAAAGGCSAAAAGSGAAAALGTAPPAYDGERCMLVADIAVYGTAEVCWTAAQELAGAIMTQHEVGGSMSSTELAQLLSILSHLNNPYLLEAYFSGPLPAAVAYATSHMKAKVAANGHSVFYITTADGRHFNWADLSAALVQCCTVMPWQQVKEWLMPLSKEYLVTVRDTKLTSADDDMNQYSHLDRSHRNPLAFEAAYSQVVSLVLQLMGQPLRASTIAVLKQRCIHVPEQPKISGIKYHYSDDLYTDYDYSDSDQEREKNDSHIKYKTQQAIEAAVKTAATATETAMAADGVLPSPRALSDLHASVSCDLGPDQMMSGVLSGLPGWQLQMCKDMLEALLEVVGGEDWSGLPVETYQRDFWDPKMPIIYMARDAGLLLSLFQAVYVLGSGQQLQQLVQHITRQPRLYDPAATVAPAALEFCHWLGDIRLAESPGAVQLLQDCLTALQQLTEGGPPDAGREKWRITDTDCMRLCSPKPGQRACNLCEALEEFLLNGTERGWRFSCTRKDRDHLRGVVPPYITWSAEQLHKHTHRCTLNPRPGPQPDASVLQAAAKCPIEVLSDTDDPESRQPDTVRRAEQAAAAAVRTAQKQRSKSRYRNSSSKDVKPPEYVPGRRAAGMSAAKEAAMARMGVLTMQKKNKPFEKRLQQYRNNAGLLRSLQAVGSRLGWPAPSAAAAAAGTSAAAAAAAGDGGVELITAVKQETDTPDVRPEGYAAAATAASRQEHSSPAEEQEQLVYTGHTAITSAAAAAAAGAVRADDQLAAAATTKRRTKVPRSNRKRERSPAAAAAPDAPVTRSRAAALAPVAGPRHRKGKKGKK